MNLVIETIAYLCEYMMQLLCIHAFLGKKIKVNLKLLITGSLFVVILLTIVHFKMSEMFTLLPHIVMFIYILIEFRIKIIDDIILILFNILISGSLQLLIAFPVSLFSDIIVDDSISALIINVLALFIMAIIYSCFRLQYNTLYNKTIEYDQVIIRVLCIVFILFIYLFVSYKVEEEMEILSYFTTALLAFVVVGIVFNWQKDRYEIKQKNLELYMHELYGKTFEGMIENIRIRQHDFKNQIAAIYGMHLTAENFEELVENQKKYCDYIMKESKYDSILTKCKDKILAGFLYTKFTEWEKKGASFEFDILLSNAKCNLATYEMIELSGILLDNASEYVIKNKDNKTVRYILKDYDDKVVIKCRNQSAYMTQEEIGKMFQKGYSTKGKDRGLGLYNVKKMLDGKGQIIVENQMLNEKNYIEFNVEIYREKS
ncbi:MAG: sensor histidine kinase [Eubacterium sp.]